MWIYNTGSLPKFLPNAHMLEHVELDGNRFVGEIPREHYLAFILSLPLISAADLLTGTIYLGIRVGGRVF